MAGLAGKLAQRVGWTRLAGLLVLACLVVLRAIDPAPLSALRLAVFDLYQQANPRPDTPTPVLILDIDDASLAELGQWPWPRNRLAALVDAATDAGATALAFDIVFSEPDRLSPQQIAADNETLSAEARQALLALPENDLLLAEAFARSTVIVGQTSLRWAETDPAEGDARPLDPVPHAIVGADPVPWLLSFPRAVRNLPVLEAAAAGEGVFSVRPDADGIFRRVPVAVVVQDQLRLGLAPELLRVAAGSAPFTIRTNAAGVEAVILARRVIATDRDGTVWPWLRAPTPDRYVSAADLLAGRVPQERFDGQLVLIGTSAIGLEDFRPTPLGVPMAGVEIHAQVLENLLSDTLLLRPNYAAGAELAIGSLMGLSIVVAAPMVRALWLAIGSVAMLGGIATASLAAFTRERLLFDASWPLLSALVLLVLMMMGNYLREERRRRRIRNAFGQYVSPELVSRLSDSESALQLGGETRELTVLFSDLRGFTALSEGYRRDPQGLTTLMNELLTRLSDPILAQGGTIDKFMGDAVMAFWNAPLDHPDPEAAACRAALAMRDGIAQMNENHRQNSKDGMAPRPLEIGLGLNTGPCVVGNMGSAARFDYTALGDTVNLASRLEGQSRPYGVGIVLGDATAHAVAGRFATLELDLIRVKGKSEPARIHALLGDETLSTTPAFTTLKAAGMQMLRAYRAQDWTDANAALETLAQESGEAGLDLSVLVALYRARIASLQAHPPAPDWDGVFTATAK
jgi:adenylate cyclase